MLSRHLNDRSLRRLTPCLKSSCPGRTHQGISSFVPGPKTDRVLSVATDEPASASDLVAYRQPRRRVVMGLPGTGVRLRRQCTGRVWERWIRPCGQLDVAGRRRVAAAPAGRSRSVLVIRSRPLGPVGTDRNRCGSGSGNRVAETYRRSLSCRSRFAPRLALRLAVTCGRFARRRSSKDPHRAGRREPRGTPHLITTRKWSKLFVLVRKTTRSEIHHAVHSAKSTHRVRD
jgi:hypothetical protein